MQKTKKSPKNYHKFSIIHEVSNLIPVKYNKNDKIFNTNMLLST